MPIPPPTTTLTHAETITNGVRLHYVTAGDPADPLIILLHGFPEYWYSWRHQIPTLAEAGYHVVAPDMRGYNTSEKPRGVAAYALPELVADVAGLVEHFENGPAAAIVGHDWGGLVAWEIATARPEIAERVAVLNAPHPRTFLRELRRPRQLARSWYVFPAQIPRLPELVLGLYPGGVAAVLRQASEEPDAFTDTDLARYHEAWNQPGALTAALDYYRAEGRRSVRKIVRGAITGERPSGSVPDDLPVLVLWGERDVALCPQIPDAFPKLGAMVRVERFPDAGHFVQSERPAEVSEVLLAFLENA